MKVVPHNPYLLHKLCAVHELDDIVLKYNMNNRLERAMWVLHNQIKVNELHRVMIVNWSDINVKLLGQLQPVMIKSFENIIMGDIFTEATITMPETEEVAGLKEASWPYEIVDDEEKVYRQVDTLDCMVINLKLRALEEQQVGEGEINF